MKTLSISQMPCLHDLLRSYLTKYWPEHNWNGISFEVEVTGSIICIHDTAGIKPMFGQTAFLRHIFTTPV